MESMKPRQLITHTVDFGLVVAAALMIWKLLVLITGCGNPVVVVISGSMEPGFSRGDILVLHMDMGKNIPTRIGEIVLYNVDGNPIPIIHRTIKIHQRRPATTATVGEVYALTKGDNNPGDDRPLYNSGQRWLLHHHIVGKAVGTLPYVGYITITLTEIPILKYLLVAGLGFMVIFIT